MRRKMNGSDPKLGHAELPLFPEAFVGWRSWIVEKGRLISLTSDVTWPVGDELRAKCAGTGHKAPFSRCACGVYALKSYIGLRRSSYYPNDVWGQVALWGKVIEGEDGYRAEFAYPKTLFVPYTKMRWIEILSVYGVPVKLMNPYSKKRT